MDVIQLFFFFGSEKVVTRNDDQAARSCSSLADTKQSCLCLNRLTIANGMLRRFPKTSSGQALLPMTALFFAQASTFRGSVRRNGCLIDILWFGSKNITHSYAGKV